MGQAEQLQRVLSVPFSCARTCSSCCSQLQPPACPSTEAYLPLLYVSTLTSLGLRFRYLSLRKPPATTPYGSSDMPLASQKEAITLAGRLSSREYWTCISICNTCSQLNIETRHSCVYTRLSCRSRCSYQWGAPAV
jgi:hypothetical protein